MKNQALQFSEKTDRVISRIIGSLDGWMVRIKCLALKEVDNTGKYYSCKGFYALIVQIIVTSNNHDAFIHIESKFRNFKAEKI